MYVKGFIQFNFVIFEFLCGMFEGMGYKVSVDYIKSLGIIFVEFLFVYWFLDDQYLFDKGLKNFWGYYLLGFFVLVMCYYGLKGIQGFCDMVCVFYDVGVEVILDVVYNYMVEGNEFGFMLLFKGIDNFFYYCIMFDQYCYYINDIGIGNIVNIFYLWVL